MDQTADSAITAGTDIVTALESQAVNDKPQEAITPYFPILGNALVPGKPDSVGWANYLIWGATSEKGVTNPAAFPNRDWAAVNWNILRDVLGGGTTPPTPLYIGLVMCKPILMHTMIAYEQIMQNNMSAVANPAGWMPTLPTMTTLPATLQPVDDTGADVNDTVESFFHTDSGRGISGNRLALKDSAGRRLAVGYLGAIWPFSNAAINGSAPLVFTDFDLRQKTTHLIGSPAEFASRFIRQENGKAILDLQGGIITVLGGDVTISGRGGPVQYREGGMLIVDDGNLILPSSIQRDPGATPPAPLTLATAKSGKSIVFAGSASIEAFLISSGTLKKTAGTGIRIKGGVAVRSLDFSESATDSLFKGHPATVGERNTIVWDPVFNVFNPDIRKLGMRFHLGARRSYWKTEPG